MASTEDPSPVTPAPAASAVKPAPAASVQVPPAPTPPPSPEETRRRLRFLDGLLVSVVLLFAFVTALFPANNSDFFLHAATGRLIAQGQYQIGHDPFSFATGKAYWVNHSWLFDLIVYALYSIPAAGGTILIVLKALMVAALAELMMRAAHKPGRSLWIPAVCVCLAVLTLSPKVLLQPTCVSLFFLGATYWLLRRPYLLREKSAAVQPAGKRAAPRRDTLSYWLIPPLCLLWVNLDGWFLLGPVTVGLYLLGGVLQDLLGPAGAGAEAPAPGERRTQLLVLLASVAVCLVNPHHLWAFTPPTQLGFSTAAQTLAKDPQFQTLFITPFGEQYFDGHYGYFSAAGLAFFPLALVGVASFACSLTAGRWRWDRATLWLPFFVLAVWHAWTIPFFAVVAGPIAALNFLDFAERKKAAAPARVGARARFGRVLTVAAGVLLLAVSWTGLLQSQSYERRIGCTVEADPSLQKAAEQIAAWRADKRIDADAHWFNSSPKVMNYLAWFCPGERGFLDQRLPLYDFDGAAKEYGDARRALASAGAEGASGYRTPFMKHKIRYLIFHNVDAVRSADSLARLLGAPKEWPLLFLSGRTLIFGWRPDPNKPGADPFAGLKLDVDQLAFGPQAARAAPERRVPEPASWWASPLAPDPTRLADADEAFLHILRFEAMQETWREGNLASWNDLWDNQKRHWKIQSAVACFAAQGPGGAPAGAGSLPYFLDSVDFNAEYRVKTDPKTGERSRVNAETGAPITSSRSLPRDTAPLPRAVPLPGEDYTYPLARRMYDFGPPADLYLAVRAARRAVAADPDDPRGYFLLAQAYIHLGRKTREGPLGEGLGFPTMIRQVQAVAALRHALTLNPDQEVAHGLLADLYQQMHIDDLGTLHARQYLDLKKESGPKQGETAEQFERDATDLEKRIVEKENEIRRLKDQFELRAAGKSVLDRAQVALEYGLGQTALDVLEKAKQTELVDEHSDYYARGVEQELMLWLQTGQVEKAAEVLDGADNQKKLPGVLGVLPDVGLPGYDWLKTLLAAAKGDYAEADRRLEAIQTQLARNDHFPALLREMQVTDDPDATKDLDVSGFAALIAGHLVLREAPRATGAGWLTLQDVPLEISSPRPPPPTLLVPRAREIFLDLTANGTLSVVRRQADLDALRGWLLLEAGDTPAARDAFYQALNRSVPPDRWTPGLLPLAATQPFDAAALHAVADRGATAVGVQFGGRPIALMGLKWVEGR